MRQKIDKFVQSCNNFIWKARKTLIKNTELFSSACSKLCPFCHTFLLKRIIVIYSGTFWLTFRVSGRIQTICGKIRRNCLCLNINLCFSGYLAGSSFNLAEQQFYETFYEKHSKRLIYVNFASAWKF